MCILLAESTAKKEQAINQSIVARGPERNKANVKQ
jgi:hypothetical protein